MKAHTKNKLIRLLVEANRMRKAMKRLASKLTDDEWRECEIRAYEIVLEEARKKLKKHESTSAQNDGRPGH